MKRALWSALLYLGSGAFGLLFPAVVCADYAKIGDFTYVHSEGRAAAIVVPDSENYPGLFVLSTAVPVPAQLFDPQMLTVEQQAQSLFLEFDTENKTFSRLLLGEQEFEIRGNFTLVLGDKEESVRLSVSTTESLPLVTLFVNSSTGNKDTLGFIGLTHAFTESEEFASDLQAWTVSSESSTLVKDYSLGIQGQLLLGDAIVASKFVGVRIEDKHLCRAPNSIVLNVEKSQQAKAMKAKDLPSLIYLDNARLRIQSLVQIEGSTSSQKNELFLLEPSSSRIYRVAPYSKPFVESGETYQLCTAEEFHRVRR